MWGISVGAMRHVNESWSVSAGVGYLSSALDKSDRTIFNRMGETLAIGFDKILNQIDAFLSLSKEHSFFNKKRKDQDQKWLSRQIKKVLIHKANQLFEVDTHLQDKAENSSVFKALQKVTAEIEVDFESFMNKKSKIDKD